VIHFQRRAEQTAITYVYITGVEPGGISDNKINTPTIAITIDQASSITNNRLCCAVNTVNIE
jgi:hypothetical protein